MKHPLVKSSNGTTNLHFYRDGEEYYRQKSPIFLKEFNNIHFSVYPEPPDAPVIYCNVAENPLPFEDNTFDAVDAYHVYEHLTLEEGLNFSKEIYRVLKPGGIYRLSTPDMEYCAREYLEFLDNALKDPTPLNITKYKWSVYELIDQATREKSGGIMWQSILNGEYDYDHMTERFSDVFGPFLKENAEKFKDIYEKKEPAPAPKSFLQKVFSLTPEKIKKKLAMKKYQKVLRAKEKEINNDPRKFREAVRWMHDRLSLTMLTEKAGFTQHQTVDFKTSDIPDWNTYDLDCSNYASRAIDPGVFVECRKDG